MTTLIARRRFLARSLATCTLSVAARWTYALPAQAPNISNVPAPNRDPQNHHDTHLHLFVDDAEIALMQNVVRVVNQLRKHPAPVLVADRPWEGDRAQAWGSVIQEPNGRFRMWYFAMNTERRRDELDRGGYCYAESRDGIHWEKPGLGVVEFRGRKRNNLLSEGHRRAGETSPGGVRAVPRHQP